MTRAERSWKDSLLKSGLPFEFFVSAAFERRSYLVHADYEFTRPNEHGIDVDRSVDIEAMRYFGTDAFWADLTVLAECKHHALVSIATTSLRFLYSSSIVSPWECAPGRPGR